MKSSILFLVGAAFLIGCTEDPPESPHGTPKGTCTVGDRRCSGNNTEECTASGWSVDQTCANGCQQSVNAGVRNASCKAANGDPQNTDTVCDGSATWICDGTELIVCDGNEEQDRQDCDQGAGGWCYDFGGEWEADCVAPMGEACSYSGEQGIMTIGCGANGEPTSGAACDVNDGCVENVACDEVEAQHCVGNRVYLGCNTFADTVEGGQAVLFNCSGAGNGTGTCTDGVCYHSVAGEMCLEGLIACGEGYTCEGQTAEAAGTCVAVTE